MRGTCSIIPALIVLYCTCYANRHIERHGIQTWLYAGEGERHDDRTGTVNGADYTGQEWKQEDIVLCCLQHGCNCDADHPAVLFVFFHQTGCSSVSFGKMCLINYKGEEMLFVVETTLSTVKFGTSGSSDQYNKLLF